MQAGRNQDWQTPGTRETCRSRCEDCPVVENGAISRAEPESQLVVFEALESCHDGGMSSKGTRIFVRNRLANDRESRVRVFALPEGNNFLNALVGRNSSKQQADPAGAEAQSFPRHILGNRDTQAGGKIPVRYDVATFTRKGKYLPQLLLRGFGMRDDSARPTQGKPDVAKNEPVGAGVMRQQIVSRNHERAVPGGKAKIQRETQAAEPRETSTRPEIVSFGPVQVQEIAGMRRHRSRERKSPVIIR